MLKIIRFLRIVRLLRVLKLQKLIYKLEDMVANDKLYVVIDGGKLIFFVFALTHWMACIFYFVGDYEKDAEMNWVKKKGLQDYPTREKYIISIYYSFTTITTVGYGDIHPVTLPEKLFGMVFMILACGFFAYIIGSLGTIVNRSDMLSVEFKLKQLHILQFLIHRNVPKYTRIKIMSYLDYLIDFKHEYKLEEKEVLDMLNENLRNQCVVYLNGRMLKKSKVFTKFNILFLSEITFLLRHETFSLEDVVFQEGDKGHEIFFINKGVIQLIHKHSKTFIKELTVEEYFGEFSFFTKKPRSCTARSNGFTETLVLKRSEFLHCAKNHPDAEQFFQYIRDEIGINGNFAPINTECYCCGKVGHIAIFCKDFWKMEGNVKKIDPKDFNKLLHVRMKKVKKLYRQKFANKILRQKKKKVRTEEQKAKHM